MLKINGIWEPIQDVDDLFLIAAENISYEFANELKRIFNSHNDEMEDTIRSLESKIDELESIQNDYEDIEHNLRYLNDNIDKLRSYIAKNDDGSEFTKGMKKALELIE